MTHNVSAILVGENAQALIDVLAQQLDEADEAYTRASEDHLMWDTGIGVLNLCKSDQKKIDLSVTCQTAANLYTLREAIYFRVEELKAQTPVELVWQGDFEKLQTPPNFRLVELVQKTHIEPHYIRLRFASENLADYSKSGMHFRFIIAPEGRKPVWPTVNAEGRTDWPVGDDMNHMPAYTFRHIDAQAGHFDVDVYLHGNGRTCAWAESLTLGEFAGAVGPGGGWIPDTNSIFMAGDETALPAIARIIESYDEDVQGLVLIETDGNAKPYPINNKSDIEIVYFERKGDKSDLPALIRASNVSSEDYNYLWIAGEAKLAQFARQYFREEKRFDRKKTYIAKYWQAISQN